MTQEHPITPPPDLVQQWLEEYYGTRRTGEVNAVEQHLATQAARWGADQQLQLDAEQVNRAWQKGADQELETCCEWLIAHYWKAASEQLRATRRPKPPSLKEQAIKVLDDIGTKLDAVHYNILLRALETLSD